MKAIDVAVTVNGPAAEELEYRPKFAVRPWSGPSGGCKMSM